jgi:hypothetical protein
MPTATLVISAAAVVLAAPTISSMEHASSVRLTFRDSNNVVNLRADIPLDSLWHTVGSCIPPHMNTFLYIYIGRVALTLLNE